MTGGGKTAGKAVAMATAATLALGGSAEAAEPGELTIFNPGGDMGPVVYDNVGHILGVAERRVVPPLDSMGCYVLRHGWIIVKKGTAVCPPVSAAPSGQEGSGESVPA